MSKKDNIVSGIAIIILAASLLLLYPKANIEGTNLFLTIIGIIGFAVSAALFFYRAFKKKK